MHRDFIHAVAQVFDAISHVTHTCIIGDGWPRRQAAHEIARSRQGAFNERQDVQPARAQER
jgi:hypothetical protein